MDSKFDAIVVGSGQAGPALAVRLAKSGLKTALVERSDHYGGTCVNNGCTPTKTLVASARVAHVVRTARDFGVLVDGGGATVSVDYPAVAQRMQDVVDHSRSNLTTWLRGTSNLSLVRGEARFLSPTSLSVDGGDTLTADRIFLNVGARPVVPGWVANAGVPYLTNESIVAMRELPSHLVILGGSYIALEFAQIYRRFGSRVTVVDHGEHLMPREDVDASDAVRDILQAEGIVFEFGVDASGLSTGTEGTGIRLEGSRTSDGAAFAVEGSHLLLAIGRTPNSDTLDVEKAGLALDKHGYIVVDDALRTNVPSIWALGDVNGRGAFTHTAYNDYEIVAANLLDNDPRRVSDRVPVYALFTDPPLARIGMSKSQVLATGKPALIGHMPMTRVARARERGEMSGFMEVLIDKDSELILGATLLCIDGDEVIHSLLDVMAARLPYTHIARTMHIHPTVSELIPTLLQDLKPLA